MDIDKYSYLWEQGNYDNVLIKGNLGYTIFNKVKNSFLIMENEVLSKQVIDRMLQNGNPIYESITDLKDNCNPINIIGQPSKAEDFSIKRYKLSIQWSKNSSLITQVKNLKDAFSIVKDKSNQELLEIARKYGKWHFDTLYLDKGKMDEILYLGKESGLDIILEYDDLKEIF